MDLKLELNKDILADLIYLEEKGIIKIDYYEIITITNKNYKFLDYEKHLEYLCTKIDNKKVKDILNDKEIYIEYENLITNSLYEEGLIKPYESRGKGIVVLIIILIFAYSLIFNVISFDLVNGNAGGSLNIYKFFSLYIMLFIVICFFSVIMIVIKNLNKTQNVLISRIMNKAKLILGISNMKYARTKKGKRDVSLLISYYKFIKDFSIMEKREFQEKNLWGYYFAYGLSLGINKKVIKKFNLEYNRYFID